MTFLLGVGCSLYYVAIAQYHASVLRAREQVLQENLIHIRMLLTRYVSDRGTPPRSLEELVKEGYLKEIPVDPVTEQKNWKIIYGVHRLSYSSPSGIIDIRSTSTDTSSRGTPYSEW